MPNYVYIIVFEDNILEMIDSLIYVDEKVANAVCKSYTGTCYANPRARKLMVRGMIVDTRTTF